MELSKKPLARDLVYLSVDVNGLKRANDTLGHVAGDEIIVATAQCLSSVFAACGKVYRIGGDEFAAILHADAEQLSSLQEAFTEAVCHWKGKLVDSLTVSSGYVTMDDVDDTATINTIGNMADQRMYQVKSHYYISNGIDRRVV